MTLYCDLRFASDKARFSTAFSSRGLIAEHGISWLLPRIVGVSNALDLLYSARMVDAHEALRIGLVNRVFSDEKLMEGVISYASELASYVSPRSLKVMKKQIYNALFQTLAEATETADEELLLSIQSEDFKEGVAHFIEKRAPKFPGK
jgi:enoyl-CoA hydratase/carnithine racemase